MVLVFLMGCKSFKVKFDNGVEFNLGSYDYYKEFVIIRK